MLRLPLSLERRLIALFPSAEERERFLVDAIEEALVKDESVLAPVQEDAEEERRDSPVMVGGTLHLFTDGGSRGNPGEAAIGCVLEDPSRGETLEEKAERIGQETNNVAEYWALVEGLKMAQKYQPNRLICHLDSELVVKQVNGEYKVKMATLQPFVEQIRALSLHFPDVIFRHIPRKDNYRADALVNKALDEHPAPHAKMLPAGGQSKMAW